MIKKQTVELNLEEIFQGAVVGVMRMTKALKRGNNTINNSDNNRAWQFHVEGALAEMAVAKATRKYWSSGTVKGLDIGDWEIRCTPRPGGDLVIRDRDVELGKMDKVFILVNGQFGKYNIMGWILGQDGVNKGTKKDPTGGNRPPAWFVPASELNSGDQP